jgi:hypothetical protein
VAIWINYRVSSRVNDYLAQRVRLLGVHVVSGLPQCRTVMN